MNEQPNYYAVIPANVRYAKINANAKLLYGEITALSNKEGFCFASNSYFASLYQVDISTIKRWIKELKDNDFIYIVIDKENGNNRKIYLGAKMSLPSVKNEPTPRGKNEPHNNTSINNTNNNNKKKKNFDAEIFIKEMDKEEEIKTALLDWLEIRKVKKIPTTQRALTLALNLLNRFDTKTQLEMLNQSIMNGWQGVFEIKGKTQPPKNDYSGLPPEEDKYAKYVIKY